jgi:hypothetical protein
MITVTRKISLLFLSAAMGLGLVSCMKNNNDQPDIPSAGLMAFNLAPDQDGIFVRLSGNTLSNQAFGYSNFTGGYLPVFTGNRDVKAINALTGTEISTTGGFNFEPSKYYTVFVTGADSVYTNLIVNDHLDTLLPASGEALVRFVQAIPDSAAYSVTLKAGSKEVPADAPFNTVSEFSSLPAGDLSITASNSNGSPLQRTIQVEANKAYTILIIGDPAATDDTRKPQIKFIVNGTVTPDDKE